MSGTTRGRLEGLVCRYAGGSNANGPTLPGVVYVVQHAYLVDGRISNWVSFRYVDDDGTIGEYVTGDYDWNQFEPIEGAVTTNATRVVFPKDSPEHKAHEHRFTTWRGPITYYPDGYERGKKGVTKYERTCVMCAFVDTRSTLPKELKRRRAKRS